MEQPHIVVVVEDDPSMLKGLGRLLNTHGFEVVPLTCAEDVFFGINPGEVLCLILDICLSGRSGIELARQLANSGIHLPVIFITGNSSEVIRNAALEVGFVAYLIKPFSAEALIDAIAAAIAQPRENMTRRTWGFPS